MRSPLLPGFVAGVVLGLATATHAAEKPTVLMRPGAYVAKDNSVVVVDAGKPGPDAKDHAAIATVTDFSKPAVLPGVGPFDVYVQPKGGLAVRIVAKWTPVAELKLGDHLGYLFVRGDNLPRADVVVVTATDDPGPGEKGHKPHQQAADYKVNMLVLPGTYAVWIKPANGARAVKIVDNVRILAGRETQAPEV